MTADFDIIQTVLSGKMGTSGFPLIYKGELTHEIIKFFSSMAEDKISTERKDKIYVMKVFHIMIECLQNISKHSDDFEKGKTINGNGIFILGKEDKTYYVITGNKIQNEKVESLKERIQFLNSLNLAELNELHKNQLIKTQISTKGGAGLGLIDIARKTQKDLISKFYPLDKESQYFVLKVNITN